MSRPSPSHADLVARALGALSGAERARVNRALARDPALRRQFEEIAGHLLEYEHLPPAPPPPPFARLAEALEGDGAVPDPALLDLQRTAPRARAAGRRWIGVAAAAAVLVALLLWKPWAAEEWGTRVDPYVVPGRGIELVRAGRALPAPAQARVAVQAGDTLRCRGTAEARLGERVRLVLDGGGALRIEEGDAVTLERGRCWFEVAPGGFEVRTAFGPVRVVGTAFEVDVRGGALEVAVAHGRVIAGGLEILAEHRLAGGRVGLDARGAGAWFGRPELRVENGHGPHARDEPLRLTLVFGNRGNVPLTLPGPAGARTPLWISFETSEGRVVGELPVREVQVQAGREILRPGSSLRLEPGAERRLTVEILPPVGSPGAYRCRALYRPAGQPGVLSTPLDVEVR